MVDALGLSKFSESYMYVRIFSISGSGSRRIAFRRSRKAETAKGLIRASGGTSEEGCTTHGASMRLHIACVEPFDNAVASKDMSTSG